MRKLNFTALVVAASCVGFWFVGNAQPLVFDGSDANPHTAVKNQARTGTCWSFSVTSLVESAMLKEGFSEPDLSEMFTVRNIYVEKAKNYILKQGATQFGEGALGHDVIRAMATYGAMPEFAYSGLVPGKLQHDHSMLVKELKQYLDNILTKRPVPADWLSGYSTILDSYLGKVPETFVYQDVRYTPVTFAKEVLEFDPDDYVALTSFLHHPFYEPFTLEVPDNFSNGQYYNVPLDEMIGLSKHAVESGYTLMWDADISNKFFRQNQGLAMYVSDESVEQFDAALDEEVVDATVRQELFETLVTTDDHLMHVVGMVEDQDGKSFFMVKNSWGAVGPYRGYIYVSESYFAVNTISLVVPKAALDPALRTRLGL